MGYIQFRPHTELAPYIDAYWKVTGTVAELKTQKILPDGCVDIILNVGDSVVNADKTICMKNESAYLVGTMTKFKDSILLPQTNLIGIRFKPAGFSFFYQYASLHELTDQTIEFEKKLAPEIGKYLDDPVPYLDRFFLNKISGSNHGLLDVIGNIEREKGRISVSAIAAKHCITPRRLERSFRQFIGVGPKEFTNIIRFRHALLLLKQKSKDSNLLDIALDCGYYDHAHLSNEIKKYTGNTPSEI